MATNKTMNLGDGTNTTVDLVVKGSVQINKLKAPTTSGGNTFGVGANNQVLKSNGTTVYWGEGGGNYSVATSSANGLMSSTDKAKVDSMKRFDITLTAAGWTGTEAPYTQQKTCNGITASWVPAMPVIKAANSQETNQQYQEALSCISQITSSNNKLTFTCYESKPSVDLPLYVSGSN